MNLIKVEGKIYTFQDGNIFFCVEGRYEDGGKFVFDPVMGWDDLAATLNKPSEVLLEQIDELIFNATPEMYEND